MKKKYLITLSLLATVGAHAQIGINNTDPKASLHITPQKTDGSTAEGIIAPNLTRAQLISKDDRYTAALKGAIVYVTTVDGTVSTKTAKIKGSGYYYFDGSIWQPFSQAETIVPPQPWLVQGGTTQATSNTQNIYQKGGVAIGSNVTSTTVYDKSLYVNGATLFQGETQVGTSTANASFAVQGNSTTYGTSTLVGNTTIGQAGATGVPGTGNLKVYGLGSVGTSNAVYTGTNYAMHVYGRGAIGGLWVENYTNLKRKVSVGENLTAADDALIVSKGKTRLNGGTTITSIGSFTLQGNGAGAGKYLASDATGKGTWTALPAATVTTANNGVSMSGTTTQLGGALTKATTISGTGANTLTISAPSILSGALRISSGTPGAGKYLTSDAAGNATWGTLPATATNAEPWQVQGGTSQATSNTQNIYQKGGVAIGSNVTSTTVYDKSLYVNGATLLQGDTQIGLSAAKSNIVVQGNSTVYGTSIVTGNTTIGQAGATGVPGTGNLRVHGTGMLGTSNAVYKGNNYTMHIFGKGDLGGLWVENYANLKRKVSVGENLTAADDALVVANGKTILNGATTITSPNGSFTLQGNGAGAGKYLVSDASGKGTWTALPAQKVTTANNGVSMNGTTTQLGGALTKATTITGTAANTLTIAAPTTIGTASAKSDLKVQGNEYINGSLTVGSVNDLPSGALLGVQTTPNNAGLVNSTKGFMYPRVALVNYESLAPLVGGVATFAQKKEHTGISVYHVGVNGLDSGVYTWNGSSWSRMVDKIPVQGIGMYYQTANVVAGAADGANQSNMSPLPFSSTGNAHAPVEIVLPEDGSYAFNVKLYSQLCNPQTGAIITPKFSGKVIAYVGVWVNGVLSDVSEVFYQISPFASGTGSVSAANVANVVLGCSGSAGNKVEIRLGYLTGTLPAQNAVLSQGSVSPKPISNRTSLVFWKL